MKKRKMNNHNSLLYKNIYLFFISSQKVQNSVKERETERETERERQMKDANTDRHRTTLLAYI